MKDFLKTLLPHEHDWKDLPFQMQQCDLCSRAREKPQQSGKRKSILQVILDWLAC